MTEDEEVSSEEEMSEEVMAILDFLGENEPVIQKAKDDEFEMEFDEADEAIDKLNECVMNNTTTGSKTPMKTVEKYVKNIGKYQEMLDFIEEGEAAVQEAKSKEAEYSKARGQIIRAKNALKKNKYPTVSKHVKNAIRLCETEIKRVMKYKSTERIKALESMVTNLEERGIQVGDLSELIAETQSLIRKNEYEQAMEQLRTIQEKADEALDKFESQKLSPLYKKLEEQLTKLKEKIIEASAIGLDVEEFNKLAEEEAGHLDRNEIDDMEERIEGHIQKIDDAIAAEKARSLADDAVEGISYAMAYATEASKFGIDPSSAFEAVSQAEEAFEEEDYKKALELSKKAKSLVDAEKDKHFDQYPKEIIADTEELLNDLDGKGVDITKPKELFEQAKEHFDKKQILSGKDLAREAQAIAKKAYKEKISEEVANDIAVAKSKIKDIRTLGIDTALADEEIRLAEELLFDEEHFPKSQEHLKKGLSIAENLQHEYQRQQAQEALDQVNNLIMDLEREGIDTTEVSEALKVAKGFFNRGSYIVALDHLRRAQASANELQQKFIVEAVQNRYEYARNLIDETSNLGLDTMDAENLLKEVEGSIETEDFSKAKETLNKFETKTKIMKENYYSDLAQDSISSSQMLISEAKNIGIDVGEAQSLVKEAEDAFKDSNFEQAQNLASQAEDVTKNIWDGFRRETTSSAVDEIKGLFTETRGLKGVDTADAERLLAEAETALAENDFDTAIDIASQAEDRILQTKRRFAEEVFPKTYMNTHALFDEMSAQGVDVSEANELLAQAEEAFKSQDFIGAQKMMDTVFQSTEDQTHAYLLQTLPVKINETRHMVDDVKNYGIDTSEADKMLMDAENLFQEADLSQAYQNLMLVSDIAQEGQVQYLSESVPNQLTQARQMVSNMESIGVDLGDAEGLLMEAEGLFESEDLVAAKEATDNVFQMVQQRQTQFYEEELPTEFNDAESLLQEMEGYGIEVGEVDGLLREAEALYAQQDYMGAKHQLDQVKSMASGNRDQYLRNMSRSAIVTAETLIDEGRKKGVDISAAEQALSDAKNALEQDDFDNARAYVDMATDRARDVMGTVMTIDIQTEFATMYSEAEAELRFAQEDGVPMDGVAERLQQAEALFNDESDPENAMTAMTMIQEARDMAREARMDTGFRSAKKEFDEAESKVKQLEEYGIDVTSARDILEDWEDAIASGDFEKVDGLSKKLDARMKDLERPYKARQVSAAIISTNALMAEARKDNIPVGGAENLIKQAEAFIQNGETEKAEEAIKTAEKTIIDARTRFRVKRTKDELEEIESQIAELNGLGVETTDVEKIFEKAKKSAEEEHWDIAFSELNECKDLLADLNQQHLGTMCETHIKKAQEVVSELEELKIESAEPKQILLAAEGLYAKGELEEANQYALNALELGRQVKQDHFKSNASSKISEARDMFVFLKDLKANVEKPKKSMRKAHAEFKNKNYQAAIENADKALKQLKKVRKPYVEKIAAEMLQKATKMVKEAQNSGLEVKEFLDALGKANEAFGKGEFDEAESIAKYVYERSESARVDIIYHKAQSDIEDARKVIFNLKATGVDVSKAEERIKAATDCLQNRDFMSVKRNVDQARELVKEVEARNLVYTAKDTIIYAKNLEKFITSNMKKDVVEIKRAALLIQKAETAYNKANNLAAQRFAEQAVKLIENVSDADIKQLVYVSRNLQGEEILAEGKDFIAKTAAANPGMDLGPAYGLLQKAEASLRDDETFNEGKELVTQAKIAAMELERASIRDRVRDELNEIRITLMNARRQGVNIDKPTEVFKEAKEAFEAHDYRKVELLCKEAVSQLKEAGL